MKYKDFEIEDFLMDEFFIKWVKSPDEETDHFWSKWIQSNPEKKDTLLVAKEVIESMDYKDKVHLLDEEYTEIFEGIQSGFRVHSKASKVNYWLHFRRLVAVLFIVSCISLGYFVNTQIKEDKIAALKEVIIKENEKGRKSQFTLSDGTKVYLNSDSKLIFPKAFYGSERRVKLTGEAFFEVKHNNSIPFFVEVGEHEIKVLGTSFNAHHREILAVALITGKVEVGDSLGNRIYLSPNEMMIKEREGTISKTIFDPLSISGWKDNYLIFNDDKLEEVLSKLSRWYGVEFFVSGNVKKDWSYSGIYHKENLKNVMEGISITSDFSYEITGKKINITINP